MHIWIETYASYKYIASIYIILFFNQLNVNKDVKNLMDLFSKCTGSVQKNKKSCDMEKEVYVLGY